MGYYDSALICLNGHVANTGVQSYPHKNDDYCSVCGSKNICICEFCGTPIKGDYVGDTYAYDFGSEMEKVPSFCHKCGKPYPWTNEKIKALNEIISLSEITEQEKDEFNKNIPDIVSETPRTNVAALKIKIIGAKVGKEIWTVARDIFVDIASETAKKTMGI